MSYNQRVKKVEVTCIDCGSVRLTFSRASRCSKCHTANLNQTVRQELIDKLSGLGHVDVKFAGLNVYDKTSYTFTHLACGTTQTWTGSNITKQLKAHPTIAPCKKCGAKRRTDIATAGYIAKYGIDPDRIDEWETFRKVARRLTEHTYRKNTNVINPLGVKRSLGISGHHLDHRKSLIDCFKDGDTPEFAARVENLQMLTGLDNISKGRKSILI